MSAFLASLSAQVRTLVEPLLQQDGSGRAVAFDADGTLWRGDVGEDFLRYLALEQRYPQMRSRRGIYEEYERRVAQDPASGYAFAVEVMEGARETDVHEDSRVFFGRRFSGRIFRSARELLTALKARGYDVWIVSASPYWPVRAGAAALGVPDNRVIAVSCAVENGCLALPVASPVPCFDGKVEQLKARGIRPVLAVGNGELDLPMLAYAEAAIVVAPHGEPGNGLVREAGTRNWPVHRC